MTMPQDIIMEDALSPSELSGLETSQPQPSSPPAFPVGDIPSDASDKENNHKSKTAALEQMFDDDSGDDEFMSSLAQLDSQKAPLPDMFGASYTDPDVMRAFYSRLFPYRHVFQWLNHSPTPTTDFAHREFAFTVTHPRDIYMRYLSFPTADLFRKECVSKIPTRFEIGPVYSSNPRDRGPLRKSAMFRPVSKELVFDIDMDSYDPIRTCCSGANICPKCWSFITMAIKVVDTALRDDFGFKHILWVYSGRRGAHAWVCDKRARDLDDSKRRAIAGYFELVKGGDKGGKKVNVKRPLHPHVERSLRILRDFFPTSILQDQNPWAADPETLLALLPDVSLNTALRTKWESAPGRSSANKWSDIDALASSGASSTLDPKALRDAKQDILLEYTYPRLDAEVSKKLNHLLKSPFCVHPKTGRVCVPIDARRVEEFDPFAVPTVLELLGDLDQWHAEQKNVQNGNGVVDGAETTVKMPDWEKTSLKPYVDYFRGFVAGLLKDERPVKRSREDGERMEF